MDKIDIEFGENGKHDLSKPVIGEAVQASTKPVAPFTIPASTINFDEPSEAVAKAVNEDVKPNAAMLFNRCMAEMGTLDTHFAPRAEEAIRRAIFDAYTLGGAAAKLEAETVHNALGQRALEARLAHIMPTCIAVAMDAVCARVIFVTNEDIEKVWSKYTLNSEVQDGGIQYTLVDKENGNG